MDERNDSDRVGRMARLPRSRQSHCQDHKGHTCDDAEVGKFVSDSEMTSITAGRSGWRDRMSLALSILEQWLTEKDPLFEDNSTITVMGDVNVARGLQEVCG